MSTTATPPEAPSSAPAAPSGKPGTTPKAATPKGVNRFVDLDLIEEEERKKGIDIDDTGIKVESVVTGNGTFTDLFVSIMLVAAAFASVFMPLWALFGIAPMASATLATLVMFRVFVDHLGLFYATVDPQSIDIYNDRLNREVQAYGFGFYVMSPVKEFMQTVNIPNEQITEEKKVVVGTADEQQAEYALSITRRPLLQIKNGIRNWLRYTKTSRDAYIDAVIENRLGLVSSELNLVDLNDLGRTSAIVNRIFGGNDRISPLEERIAESVSVRLIRVKAYDPESKQYIEIERRRDQLVALAKRLSEKDITDAGRSTAAAVVEPGSTRITREEVVLPSNTPANVVVGEAGVAVVATPPHVTPTVPPAPAAATPPAPTPTPQETASKQEQSSKATGNSGAQDYKNRRF